MCGKQIILTFHDEGRDTKTHEIHALVDASGNPLDFILMPGQPMIWKVLPDMAAGAIATNQSKSIADTFVQFIHLHAALIMALCSIALDFLQRLTTAQYDPFRFSVSVQVPVDFRQRFEETRHG